MTNGIPLETNGITLLPCPFCGGEAKLDCDWTRDGFSCMVYCEDDPSLHRMSAAFPLLKPVNEHTAIEIIVANWNRRTPEQAIAAMLCANDGKQPKSDVRAVDVDANDANAALGGDVNSDGLPVGLTISEDGNLLNWRGENYVRQSALGGDEKLAERENSKLEHKLSNLETKLLKAQERIDGLLEQKAAATLGAGECELVYGENDHGDDGWWCQSCGGWFAASFRHTGRNNIIVPHYCQQCGKAVKR